MIEFLKNIIPRIKQYSKGLDKIEVFVDKTEPWIYIDENGGQHQYIFLREGKRLIMISNGITKIGKWELLPTKQLLIDHITGPVTLDEVFVNKALLILKKAGTDDIPFVWISREEIPDLDFSSYLTNFEAENRKSETYVVNHNAENDNEKYVVTNLGWVILTIIFIIMIVIPLVGLILNK